VDAYQKNLKQPLTRRETSVLILLAKGLSTNQVAAALQLSKSTIRTHINHIHEKLGVKGRVNAITEGLRQGIIAL
jgi:DNA-binding CsgD family transcriptional regulator